MGPAELPRLRAYALLHWRYPFDVGPAGFQGYLNPLPYVLPFALRSSLPPVWAAAVLATMQSSIVAITWSIAGAIGWRDGRPAPVLLRAAATLAGVTGAMVLSEVGTSFADLGTAILVLGGLLSVLHASRAAPGRAPWCFLLAGGLAGAAAGLKLTNLVFLPSLCLSAMLPWRGRSGVAAAGWTGGGAVMGFLVTGGPWCWYLWQTLGNPVFPAYNDVFQSSSAELSAFSELSFLPHGVFDALSYPWRIARGEHPTSENQFSDSRMLLALPLAAAFLLAAVRWQRPHPAVRAVLFLGGAYIPWLLLFSIQRYAVVLDVLSGVILVLLAARLAPGRAGLALGMAAFTAAMVTTRPADWWHRPWSDPFAAVLPAALAEPAAYISVSYPSGYWASRLPDGSRFYTAMHTGIAESGALRDRVTDGLRDPPGGKVRIFGFDTMMSLVARAKLAALGFAPSAPCYHVPSLWSADTMFCAASRVGERPLAAAGLDPGTKVDFTRGGSGWIYELDGWQPATDAGTPTAGPEASLVFWPSSSMGAMVLEIELATSGKTDLEIAVSDAVARRALPQGMADVRRLCLRDGSEPKAQIVRFGRLDAPVYLRSMRLTAPLSQECELGVTRAGTAP